MIEVSIILPVYNVEQFLKQCLDSIVNQSFKNIELIVINDCSTDNSLKIIEEYKQKDERIVLINLKENSGVSNARNEGLKIAKGKYISFIDSDDWVKQDFIETLFNNIEKYKCDVFSGSFNFYNEKKAIYMEYRYPNYIKNYKNYKRLLSIPNFTCMAWHKIYNKKFLTENHLLFDSSLKIKEDCLFFYELILAKPKIVFNNIPIYFYRTERQNSLTNNQYFILHAVKSLLKKINYLLSTEEKYKEYFKTFCIYAFLHIAYGLTCCEFSKKRTQYALLMIKQFLFNNNDNKLSISDKFVIYIFKFFLNHASLYRITAIFLKKIKRLFLSKNS